MMMKMKSQSSEGEIKMIVVAARGTKNGFNNISYHTVVHRHTTGMNDPVTFLFFVDFDVGQD